MDSEKLGKQKIVVDEDGKNIYVIVGNVEYFPDRNMYYIQKEGGESYWINPRSVSVIKPVSVRY